MDTNEKPIITDREHPDYAGPLTEREALADLGPLPTNTVPYAGEDPFDLDFTRSGPPQAD